MPVPPDLQIFFPNGGTSASQMYIWDGSKPVAWDGSISVSTTGGPIKDGVDNNIIATVIDYISGGGPTKNNPLAVTIIDGVGDVITSFGGGVQYQEGDIDATPTGTLALWWDAANTLRAVSATKPLPVDIKNASLAVTGPLTDTELRATPVPVSGTVATGGLTDTELRATAVPVSLATLPALVAGSAIIGKVGIDQTTPGTTNKVDIGTNGTVAIGTALPAGTNAIGKLAANSGVDIGDVDVTSLPALPAGTNLIGYVGGKNTYAAKATVTVTLNSLTNTSSRESTAFFSNAFKDYLIRFQMKGQAGSTAGVNVYVYEALNDGTYTDGATGTDAAFTTANRKNSRYLGTVQMNGTTAVVATMRISDVFATAPIQGGLIFDNESGGTLDTTAGNFVIEFMGIN